MSLHKYVSFLVLCEYDDGVSNVRVNSTFPGLKQEPLYFRSKLALMFQILGS